MGDGRGQLAGHTLQALTQILLLLRERHFEDSGKNLLVAKLQRFLNGLRGIDCAQPGMLISS
jgi:hypothetical protein